MPTKDKIVIPTRRKGVRRRSPRWERKQELEKEREKMAADRELAALAEEDELRTPEDIVFEQVEKEVKEMEETKPVLPPLPRFNSTIDTSSKREVTATNVVRPLAISRGLTPATAVVCTRAENEPEQMMAETFGKEDGDFFILSSQSVTITGKKLKVYRVEDSNGFKYTIWFDLSRFSLI